MQTVFWIAVTAQTGRLFDRRRPRSVVLVTRAVVGPEGRVRVSATHLRSRAGRSTGPPAQLCPRPTGFAVTNPARAGEPYGKPPVPPLVNRLEYPYRDRKRVIFRP